MQQLLQIQARLSNPRDSVHLSEVFKVEHIDIILFTHKHEVFKQFPQKFYQAVDDMSSFNFAKIYFILEATSIDFLKRFAGLVSCIAIRIPAVFDTKAKAKFSEGTNRIREPPAPPQP